MNSICVGQQDEWIATGNSAKETLRYQSLRREDGTPDVTKLFIGARQVECCRELLYEISRLDLTGFQKFDQTGATYSRRNFGRGNAGKGFHSLISAPEIKRNNDAPEIKDNCFGQFITLTDASLVRVNYWAVTLGPGATSQNRDDA